MIELIKQIDDLVYEIKNDANRTKLVELGVLLIELSKYYGEARQEYIRTKNEYERNTVMEMESRKSYLEQEEDKRYSQELIINPKAKKNKITNIEVSNYVELKLIGLKDKMSEAQMTQAYLEPIVKGYYEIILLIKFQDRQNLQDSKYMNNNQ